MGNPVVYFDICIERVCQERVVFHLFANIAPKTVENFRQLCIGSFIESNGKKLTYKGSFMHRIIPSFIIQGGDIMSYDGKGRVSIYGESFPDGNFTLKHRADGILSMANIGPNTNGCQFFITLGLCPWLDGKYFEK
jgi:cyclophilin family peptidyl-prolyl cis-trans isomerase